MLLFYKKINRPLNCFRKVISHSGLESLFTDAVDAPVTNPNSV